MTIAKRIVVILLVMAVTASLSGCFGVLNQSKQEEDTTPILAGDTTEQKPVSCMVYFAYADKYILADQQHLVSVPETKRAEEIFLQELIAGPKTASTSLQPIINPNTRVVSVSDNNGLLFVTLSSQFFTPLSGVPENWRQSGEWSEAVMRQRRLALYAIVNTLTQTGKYSKVQLYIDYSDSGQGERPTRGEMGFGDENADKLLEPLGRNTDIILRPDSSLSLFLQSFAEKDWANAASYVDTASKGVTEEDVAAELSLLDMTLVDYAITGSTTSYDGQSAIVTLNYYISAKSGTEYQNTNVSLKVVRTQDIWKLSYVSLSQLLNVSNG